MKLAAFFEFSSDWYHRSSAQVTALSYYKVLRQVLRDRPELRANLVFCCHCGIYFITDYRNKKRDDLGCPFGCQEGYRRKESNLRSLDYYRSEVGKKKKRELNRKRGLGRGNASEKPPTDQEVALNQENETGWGPLPVVNYLRFVVSRIEKRDVGQSEIKSMICEKVRQRSMGKESGWSYGEIEWEIPP